MKKKKSTKRKSKTDSVHESLSVMKQMIFSLEQQIKELNTKVEQLRYYQPYYPNPNLPAPQSPPKYWPNVPPVHPYDDVNWHYNTNMSRWYNHNKDIGWDSWDAIDKRL